MQIHDGRGGRECSYAGGKRQELYLRNESDGRSAPRSPSTAYSRPGTAVRSPEDHGLRWRTRGVLACGTATTIKPSLSPSALSSQPTA
eukprot:1211891-Rhodomonas_salina.1